MACTFRGRRGLDSSTGNSFSISLNLPNLNMRLLSSAFRCRCCWPITITLVLTLSVSRFRRKGERLPGILNAYRPGGSSFVGLSGGEAALEGGPVAVSVSPLSSGRRDTDLEGTESALNCCDNASDWNDACLSLYASDWLVPAVDLVGLLPLAYGSTSIISSVSSIGVRTRPLLAPELPPDGDFLILGAGRSLTVVPISNVFISFPEIQDVSRTDPMVLGHGVPQAVPSAFPCP